MPLPYTALVLTAAPGSSALTEADYAALSALVPSQQRQSLAWLAEGEAVDLVITADATTPELAATLKTRAEMLVAGRPVDVNVVAFDAATRRKALLVADMESTIIEQEMLDELADAVGLREKISAITARAMRGELDFEAALTERVGLLAGLDAAVLDKMYHTRVTLMAGAQALVRTMAAHGAYCALVSGGFTVFTEKVAARSGFHEHQANRLEVINGRLTGRVLAPILGRAAKKSALERLMAEKSVPQAATLTVGDGANDLDMIRAAGLGVAFRAKPLVAAEASASIRHGDLTALLYLQGYKREVFE